MNQNGFDLPTVWSLASSGERNRVEIPSRKRNHPETLEAGKEIKFDRFNITGHLGNINQKINTVAEAVEQTSPPIASEIPRTRSETDTGSKFNGYTCICIWLEMNAGSRILEPCHFKSNEQKINEKNQKYNYVRGTRGKGVLPSRIKWEEDGNYNPITTTLGWEQVWNFGSRQHDDNRNAQSNISKSFKGSNTENGERFFYKMVSQNSMTQTEGKLKVAKKKINHEKSSSSAFNVKHIDSSSGHGTGFRWKFWQRRSPPKLQAKVALPALMLRAYSIKKDFECEINWSDFNGMTILMYACFQGNARLTMDLIAVGADPLAADVLGQTPLHYAAGSGSLECMNILLRAGVPAHAHSNRLKWTPLLSATVNGMTEAAMMLLEK